MMYRCLSPLTPKILVFSLTVFSTFSRKSSLCYISKTLGQLITLQYSNGLKEHYLSTYFIIKLSFDLMITFVLHNNQQQ